MIHIRKRDERGHFDHGWLKTWHTFSFANYHDPEHMGFRTLRVINEDIVAPGQGFGTHPHRDMEILTYVLEGALRHKDSMGNGSVIRPGEVQIMSAGTGITHSEFNDSPDDPVHLLQIWVLPDRRGITPRYDQKAVDRSALLGALRPIAAPPGQEAEVVIHQDVRIYAGLLGPGQELTHAMDPKRHAWVQVARGALELDGQHLRQGDGASVSEHDGIEIRGLDDAEVLVFDLA